MNYKNLSKICTAMMIITIIVSGFAWQEFESSNLFAPVEMIAVERPHQGVTFPVEVAGSRGIVNLLRANVDVAGDESINACVDKCELIKGGNSTEPDIIVIRLSICNQSKQISPDTTKTSFTIISNTPVISGGLPKKTELKPGSLGATIKSDSIAKTSPTNIIGNKNIGKEPKAGFTYTRMASDTISVLAAGLSNVAVTIDANTFHICTDDAPLNVSVVTLSPSPGCSIALNKLFYGQIAPNECKDAENLLPNPNINTKEFRFTVPHGRINLPACIWFTAKIWPAAVKNTTNCSITLPAGQPIRTQSIFCRIR